ncbi:substrate import-associated zinc metallohydrolase lipoprotein [Ferruginibacter albus]|uniref:substrate import-associated zinc metallohydrolase lipoprotein n=1 Tax=Ferruginibacter albus TaxID=2875540 RepID=UPI001CC58C7A|nr:substrate import-associated zinc metallohydrolase lipoprotein [Ferruginibacter albus]UAY50780.1 hypothetical protein K9M53_09270 [Ferruginibacter albus]
MKLSKITVFSLAVTMLMVSCKKEEPLGNAADIPGLGGDSTAQTPIDKWIYDSLVVPYNIDVKYRWNQFTTDLISDNVVPPKEEVVIPVMSSLLRIWATPYIEETNLIFFNKIAPKFFVLSGSSAADADGATVGVAGGGRQINLLQLNYFKNKTSPDYTLADTMVQRNVFLTVHHEFSHIFDQLKRRPNAFDLVTQNDYSSDWINLQDPDANQKGFVTAYASSVATEDFAEMISHMLVYGKPGWDAFVASIVTYQDDGLGNIIIVPNQDAQQKLHAKEAAIVDYFKTSWQIDFYDLQAKVRATIEKEFY